MSRDLEQPERNQPRPIRDQRRIQELFAPRTGPPVDAGVEVATTPDVVVGRGGAFFPTVCVVAGIAEGGRALADADSEAEGATVATLAAADDSAVGAVEEATSTPPVLSGMGGGAGRITTTTVITAAAAATATAVPITSGTRLVVGGGVARLVVNAGRVSA